MRTAERALAEEPTESIPVVRFSLGSPFERLANRHLPVKVCRKGTWIFTQGDLLDSLYVVQEGNVMLTRLSTYGRETILGFINAGEFFGDVPLLNGSVAPFNAYALSRTVLLVVRNTEFKCLLQDPEACRELMAVLAERCYDAWAQIEVLGGCHLGEKVRIMLSWLCTKMGVKTAEGIEIKVNQSQLAQMVGTTRESLNRQIGLLKKESVLSVRKRCRRTSLLILAPEKLAAI